MKKTEFLPLYKDLMFKEFFGTTKYIDLTTYLLETIFKLSPGSLKGSHITNSVTLDKETVINKGFELDIKVKTPNGEIYDIEMQTIYDKDAEIKNVMYITKLFSGQLESGELYSKIKPITLINLVKENKQHKREEIISKYVMTNVKDIEDTILEEYLTIYIVDIAKEVKIEYNEDNKFEELRKFINASSYEEAKEITKGNDLLRKVLEEMVIFMGNEYIQDYSRERTLIETRIDTAKKEGKKEGITVGVEMGKTEEKIEIAKMLMNTTNLSLEEISKCTGLPKEKLESLKES